MNFGLFDISETSNRFEKTNRDVEFNCHVYLNHYAIKDLYFFV